MGPRRLAFSRLLILDVGLINLSFVLSYIVRYRLALPYPVDPRYDSPFFPYIPYAALLTVLCLAAYRANGLYQPRPIRRWLDEVFRIFNGTTTSIVLVMAITFFVQPLVYSRGMLVLADFLIVGFLSLVRLGERIVASILRRRGIGVERVLIVGAGEVGRAVMRTILADPALGYHVIGYLDDDPSKGHSVLGRFKGLGPSDNLAAVLTGERVDEVIVSLPWMYHRKIMQLVEECERHKVRVWIVPDVFQQRLQRVDLDTLHGIPLIGVEPRQLSNSAQIAKRAFELVGVIVVTPVLALLFGLIAAMIKFDSPGPVLFRQRRVGKDGQEFDIFKFRSMIHNADELKSDLADLNEADGPLFKIKADPRMTRIGRWLRRFSIDELPQVINVLRGEMSMVGPRPGTPEEVAQYEPWQRARLLVKPGLTGLWQVNGRSDLPFDEGCLLDIYYIENWTLEMDFQIIIQTIPRILVGAGAY